MKKTIVITSIFKATEAVKEFSQIPEYNLIVVGDKKSPATYDCKDVKFLSVKDQQATGFKLQEVLPYNHYCRKMLGYLYAIKEKAEFIIDTDDDNIPKKNWNFPESQKIYDHIKQDRGFVNIYQLYTDLKIWPRGLPLQLISKDFKLEKLISQKESKVGIWQGLADEDPDVDAIYRLTSDTPCNFKERRPVVLGKGTISPFNSQNTSVCRELFPLLYLPTNVTFRFTDILRGLIAQPIMWLYDYELGFMDATVIQKRNPHDYMKDFISEIPMYEYGDQVVDIVSGAINPSQSMSDNLHNAYNALHEKQIVKKEEMITLESWLEDLANLSR